MTLGRGLSIKAAWERILPTLTRLQAGQWVIYGQCLCNPMEIRTLLFAEEQDVEVDIVHVCKFTKKQDVQKRPTESLFPLPEEIQFHGAKKVTRRQNLCHYPPYPSLSLQALLICKIETIDGQMLVRKEPRSCGNLIKSRSMDYEGPVLVSQ